MFNIDNPQWSVIASLDAPNSRKNHATCSIGNLLILFGGQDDIEYYNDIYALDTTDYQWYQISYKQSVINPRSGSCMVCYYPYVYIVGGYDGSYYNDIWVLDLNSYILQAIVPYNYPVGLAFHRCFIRSLDNDVFLYAVLGTSKAETINHSLYIYSVGQSNWTSSFLGIGRIDGDIVYVNNTLAVFGGNDGNVPLTQVIVIDLDTYQYSTYQRNLSISRFRAVYYRSSVYVVLGAQSLLQSEALIVEKAEIFEIQNLNLQCSLGTYSDGLGCSRCPEGSYSDGSTSICSLCPKGTYSSIPAAVTLFQCQICPGGFYNPYLGASKCLTCLANNICTAGSITPSKSSLQSYNSSQPVAYSLNISEILASYLDISMYSLISGISIIFLLLIKSKHLPSLDIYAESHNYQSKVPMIYKKTLIGAYFSTIFCIVVTRLIISEVTNFNYENISETKRLVSYVSIKQEEIHYETNMTITCKFFGYGDQCVYNETCSNDFSIIPNNLAFSYASYNCVKEDTACVIRYSCNDCKIHVGGSISFKLKEGKSYASSFLVTIETTSSIPGMNSSISQMFYPEDTDAVFRGINPSVLEASMIASLFLSDYSEWPSMTTGYHISYITMLQPGSYTYSSL